MRRTWVGLAVAVALALALGILLSPQRRPQPPPVASSAARAAPRPSVAGALAPICDESGYDVDHDGEVTASTDGVLAQRYLFGFFGAQLTEEAIGANARRSDPGVVAARLACMGELLDVDGDGEAQALTDGLLLLRYLAGDRGAALVSSAVGASCARCDAAAIEAFLAGGAA